MDKQAINEYLLSHSFFGEFSDSALKFLGENSETQTIKQGEIIFCQGEKADKFFIILSGKVAVQVQAIMGPNLVIQLLGTDQVLGWSWLIPPYKWSFQALAREDSELLMFNGAAILDNCEQDAKFGYEVLKKFAELMSVRLDAARRKMMDEWNPDGFA